MKPFDFELYVIETPTLSTSTLKPSTEWNTADILFAREYYDALSVWSLAGEYHGYDKKKLALKIFYLENNCRTFYLLSSAHWGIGEKKVASILLTEVEDRANIPRELYPAKS